MAANVELVQSTLIAFLADERKRHHDRRRNRDDRRGVALFFAFF